MNKSFSVGILGAGTWGTALARLLAINGRSVALWSAVEHEIDTLAATRRHPHLPDVTIPAEITLTKDIAAAVMDRDLVIFAVSSAFIRTTAHRAAPHLAAGQIVANVAKGIEERTLMTLSEVIADEIQKTSNIAVRTVALSGPTHAEEVAAELPTAIVSASRDAAAAAMVQDILMSTFLRVYTSADVRGVELCGALKNIVALAAGISTGLGFGDNTKAALLTRGMAEIVRLGTAMGCNAATFYGLAGIGDMIVTATSRHSRNNRAGELLARGYDKEQAVAEIGMVVEGFFALPAALRLAEIYQVELPIIFAVNDIVHHGADPHQAVLTLMTREKNSESFPC